MEGRGRCFSFAVPDGWRERSTLGFSAPPSPERPMVPTVLVSVGDIPPDEELGSFVDRQIDDIGHRADGFTLSLRRSAKLDGAACEEIVFSWDGGQTAVKQRQIFVRRPGNRLVSITHTAPAEEFAAADTAFGTMLRTFSWVGEPG